MQPEYRLIRFKLRMQSISLVTEVAVISTKCFLTLNVLPLAIVTRKPANTGESRFHPQHDFHSKERTHASR